MFHRYELVKHPTGNFFTDYRKVNYFDYHEVDELIGKLNESGYRCYKINKGTLGSGDWICVPPDDNHYYYVINECYINEWSSGHRIRRCSKLSKANQKLLEEVA